MLAHVVVDGVFSKMTATSLSVEGRIRLFWFFADVGFRGGGG
jgi:hypothetical protein